MRFVRIGDSLINPAAIVKVTDSGLKKTNTGEMRVLVLHLANDKQFFVGGNEADAVWAAAQGSGAWPEMLTPVTLPAAVFVG